MRKERLIKHSEAQLSRIKISAWPWVSGSIALAVFTWYLLGLYSMVHWRLVPPAHALSILIKNIPVTEGKHESTVFFEQAKKHSDKLITASSKLLYKLEAYRYFGMGSLILAAISFIFRPRWACIIALPFAILAGIMSVIIM